MTQLPDPLTSSDCDLRDFPFMPLDVVRLRDSDISAISSGDEFRCAVLLWCASWHQVPAASIPDDDIVLAQYAGFGRVVKEWKKVREGALRGWVKCADGRLYHPVVAEKANEAWAGRIAYRAKKEAERLRKANERASKKGHPDAGTGDGNPADKPKVSDGQDKDFHGTGDGNPADKPKVSDGQDKDFHGTGDGNPAENALIGKGTVDRDSGEGEGQLKERAAQDSESSALPPGESAAPSAYEQLANQLQKAGVSITSSHPNVIAWVGRGVTAKQALEAVAIARQRKPDGPIPANYLVPIIEEILNPPAASSAKPSGASGAWRFSDEGTLAKGRELDMPPHVGELMEPYRSRLSVEIERRRAVE